MGRFWIWAALWFLLQGVDAMAGEVATATDELQSLPYDCIECDSFKLADRGYVFRFEKDARLLWTSESGSEMIGAYSLGSSSGETVIVLWSNGFGVPHNDWRIVYRTDADLAMPEFRVVVGGGGVAYLLVALGNYEPPMVGVDDQIVVRIFDVRTGDLALSASCSSIPDGSIDSRGIFHFSDVGRCTAIDARR